MNTENHWNILLNFLYKIYQLAITTKYNSKLQLRYTNIQGTH